MADQIPQPDPEHVEPEAPRRDGRGKILSVRAFEKDSALLYIYEKGYACTCGRVRCKHYLTFEAEQRKREQAQGEF